jgi:hypothetical protein
MTAVYLFVWVEEGHKAANVLANSVVMSLKSGCVSGLEM